uniref:5'-methylthioadenosine/S-adenosylhomocysteine nucleosidase 1 n=1 Tax=Noccaea caerulescens TaxID=107243 RepID=A0A1J3DXH8_NOCCA
MAPHGDGSDEMEKSEVVQSESRRPISTVVFVIAMQAEALPLVNKFGLSETSDSPLGKGLPWVVYEGVHKELQINVVCPGRDAALGIDSVGTVPASLITFASIQALKPDLIINAGTCGGFKVKGANIGDVFLVSDVVFHDRRIPIPMFDLYGVGLREAFSTPNLLKELNLKIGRLSTGDSLDMSTQDETLIIANDATLKDMEGAAVAYVADLMKVPVMFLKAVTDLVDGDKPTAEEFLQNLALVTSALEETATKVINFINAKNLSDL